MLLLHKVTLEGLLTKKSNVISVLPSPGSFRATGLRSPLCLEEGAADPSPVTAPLASCAAPYRSPWFLRHQCAPMVIASHAIKRAESTSCEGP